MSGASVAFCVSTDLAAWHALDEVTGLERVELIDIGLALWRKRPPVGRIAQRAQGPQGAQRGRTTT